MFGSQEHSLWVESFRPDTLEGYVGFTSLDNTYFKLRMIDVDTSTVDATNSPSYAYPTWLIC